MSEGSSYPSGIDLCLVRSAVGFCGMPVGLLAVLARRVGVPLRFLVVAVVMLVRGLMMVMGCSGVVHRCHVVVFAGRMTVECHACLPLRARDTGSWRAPQI